jgi:hypothetical protein
MASEDERLVDCDTGGCTAREDAGGCTVSGSEELLLGCHGLTAGAGPGKASVQGEFAADPAAGSIGKE